MAIDGLYKGKQFTADTITSREVLTAAASGLSADSSSTEGGNTSLALSDHTHAIDSSTGSNSSVDAGDSASNGTAAGFSRKDHQHAVSTATATDITDASSEGSSTDLARSDHDHGISAAAKLAVLNSENKAWGVQADDVVLTAATSDSNDALAKKILDASQTKRTDGSSTVSGIDTTAPSSTQENKVQLRDATTGDPFEDASNRQVFGRLTDAFTDITADLTWNGTTTVTSADTSGAIVGEWIGFDSDGQFFEVASIAANVSFTITNPGGLTIPTGSGASGSQKVDLTLSYFVDISGTETAHTHSGADADIIFIESLGFADASYQSHIIGIAFAESLPAGHTHDDRYFTESEFGTVGSGNPNTTSGAALVATDASAIGGDAGASDHVQGVLEAFQSAIDTLQGAAAGTPNMEDVDAQAVTGTDTALTNTLVNTPTDNDTLLLFLNGQLCPPDSAPGGAANEGFYSISGQTITWLAATGLAPDLTTDDQLIAYYRS